MAPAQVDLRACWHTAAPGRLTAWQQALACGLREASKELYGGHVAVTWIASKLRKTDETGRAYNEDAPEQGSLSEFFRKVDADPRLVSRKALWPQAWSATRADEREEVTHCAVEHAAEGGGP